MASRWGLRLGVGLGLACAVIAVLKANEANEPQETLTTVAAALPSAALDKAPPRAQRLPAAQTAVIPTIRQTSASATTGDFFSKDPALAALAAKAKPLIPFVYNGRYFAKAQNGSIKPLMPPSTDRRRWFESLAPKYRAMTLEERLKKDPDYLRKVRDRELTTDTDDTDGASLFPKNFFKGSSGPSFWARARQWLAPKAYAYGTSGTYVTSGSKPGDPVWMQSGQVRPSDQWVKDPTGAYTAYTLSEWQTPIRDQQDRGVCWDFAGTAMLEAAYRHAYGYGINFDLSEQFANHVNYSTVGPGMGAGYGPPPGYHGENFSSFWDWWGGFVTSYAVALMNYTIPEEGYAPYLNHGQMAALASQNGCGNIMMGADSQAQIDWCEYQPNYISPTARANAVYGVQSATLFAASDTDAIESFIIGGHEVAFGSSLYWGYNAFDPSILDYDPNGSGGGHAMMIVGFDRTNSDPDLHYFLVKNSWGDPTFLKVSYNFFRNAGEEAAAIMSVRNPSAGTPYRALWLGKWLLDDNGTMVNLIIRRTSEYFSGRNNPSDRLNTAATELGQYAVVTYGSSGTVYGSSGTAHPLNGRIINGDKELYAYADLNATHDADGATIGKNFQTYLYSSNTSYAAGISSLNGALHGAFLSRSPVSHPGLNSAFTLASWPGSWSINYDGTIGTLTINPGYTITYASNSVTRTVTPVSYSFKGTFSSSDLASSNIVLTVPFKNPTMGTFTASNMPFTMYGHSTESGFLSGSFTWGGQVRGANATRR